VLDLDAAAQTDDVGRGIATGDALPTGVLGPVFFEGSNLLFTGQAGHKSSLLNIKNRWRKTSPLSDLCGQPSLIEDKKLSL